MHVQKRTRDRANNIDVLPQYGRGVLIKRDSDRGATRCRSQATGTPRYWNKVALGIKYGQRCSKAPGQLDCASGGTSALEVLLRELTIRWCVCLYKRDKSVGVVGDSRSKRAVASAG